MASVGFCGADKRRPPLQGTELRGCWTAPLLGTETVPPRIVAEVDPGVRLRGFVPVELARRDPDAVVAAIPPPVFDPSDGWANRATLFGDAEG